ncbi:hypothetical protein ACTMTF_16550 [Nonomuraea sp. ZG12]|uniref:hypothetical protein n=1 Tax=Nonomuraea sp. ZG12 TaxID=3452207 RepID=UPI003F8B614C
MTVTRRPRVLAAAVARPRSAPGPVLLLALVSVLYGVAQLVIVSPWMGIGWDETVYASQYAGHAPPAVFSAPRARGVPLLVAPVVAVTDSVFALRLYLTLLSSLALFGAYYVWLRVRADRSVPLAALLFGACWLSLFYGNEAMPNLYVALGAVAATGFLALLGRSRAALFGLGASLAVVSLLRPSDSLFLAVPLGVAALLTFDRRRLLGLVAMAAGLAVGWGQWLVEALTRFGGVAERLRAAEEANLTGLTVSVLEHAQALDGPSLCRFGVRCGEVSPIALVWWLAIPATAVLGVWVAWRAHRPGPVVLAAVTGLAVALPYLFYVGYAAPRFLMPAYALLALPVAVAATGLGRDGLGRDGRWRGAVAGVMAAGVLAHLALQGAYAYKMAGNTLETRQAIGRATEELRRLGVRPPCLVYGQSGVQIGYLLGCESQGVIQGFASRTPTRVRELAEGGHRLVMVYTDLPLPRYARDWDEVVLTGRWKARFAPAGGR